MFFRKEIFIYLFIITQIFSLSVDIEDAQSVALNKCLQTIQKMNESNQARISKKEMDRYEEVVLGRSSAACVLIAGGNLPLSSRYFLQRNMLKAAPSTRVVSKDGSKIIELWDAGKSKQSTSYREYNNNLTLLSEKDRYAIASDGNHEVIYLFPGGKDYSNKKKVREVSIYDLISHREGYYIFMEYVCVSSLLLVRMTKGDSVMHVYGLCKIFELFFMNFHSFLLGIWRVLQSKMCKTVVKSCFEHFSLMYVVVVLY